MSNQKELNIQYEKQNALAKIDSFEKNLRESCVPEKEIQQIITARVKKEVFDQIVFSPDGKYIAMKIAELVYIWDREQNRNVQVLKNKNTIGAIAFSLNGKYLYSTENKEYLFQIKNICTGSLIKSFPIGFDVEKIDVISEKNVLLNERVNKSLIKLNIKTGEKFKYNSNAHTYAVSKDRKEIITTKFMYEPLEENGNSRPWYAIKFWDVDTGICFNDRQIDLDRKEPSGIALTPNNDEVIVFIKDEPLIKIINRSTKKIREINYQYLNSVEMYKPIINSTGKYLLSTGGIHSQDLFLWELSTGRMIMKIEGKFDGYAFSPDGTEIAVDRSTQKNPYPDLGVEIWNIKSGEKTQILKKDMDTQTNFVLSPTNDHFVTDASEHDLSIWNMKNGHLIHTLSGHKDFIADVKFSPNGKLLASASHDNTIRIWDIETGYCINLIHLYRRGNALTFSPDGTLLAVAEGHAQEKRKISIRDIYNGNIIYQKENVEYGWHSMQFDKNGEFLLLGDSSNYNMHGLSPVHVWYYKKDLFESFKLNNYQWERNPKKGRYWWFSSPIFYQGKKNLIIGHNHKTIHVFDIDNGEEILCLEGHQDYISTHVLHPSQPILISADDSNKIFEWDLNTGEITRSFDGLEPCVWKWRHIRSLSISSDEKMLIASSMDGMISYWNYITGQYLATSYALDQGYLWTTPSDEFAPTGWLYTNRTDLISLIEFNKEDQKNAVFISQDDIRFMDHMRMFNDQEMVMTRLNDWDRYQELLKSRLMNKERTSEFLLEDRLPIKLLVDDNRTKI